MKSITPYLWFDGQAEEAINLYTSLFKNSKIISIKYWPDDNPFPGGESNAGKVMNGVFELDGRRYVAFDAGPYFKFNESISLFVACENQEEIDFYWEKLTADGGQESQCGWLKDKFGMSWQIVPYNFEQFTTDNVGGKKAKACMEKLMTMQKLDIQALEDAYNNA